GIAMFATALALMPVLVVWYQHHPVPAAGGSTLTTGEAARPGDTTAVVPASTDTAAPASPAPRRTVSDRASGAAAATPALLGFTGIVSGSIVSGLIQNGVVSGVVQIGLAVSGSPGTILFRLSGSASMSYVATGPPFLFLPQELPWNTTQFPNGLYMLTATAAQQSIPPLSVTFQVINQTAPRSPPS
ncbi:hypothetical protein, partial [Frankia sp. CiP3]|uniref:hypothetical protein n=1 Tax=Frankia sp. CiP3 TaxID=2880971 RepID=UPI001EF73341